MKSKLYLLLIVALCLLLYGCNDIKNNEDERIIPDNTYKVTFNDLELYLPNGLNSLSNEDNLYTYNMNNNDDKCSVSILLKNKKDYDDSAVNYIQGKAGIKKSDIDKIMINNFKWFNTTVEVDNSEKTYIYASVNGEYIYAIRYNVKIEGEVCKQGLDNINSTLYFTK